MFLFVPPYEAGEYGGQRGRLYWQAALARTQASQTRFTLDKVSGHPCTTADKGKANEKLNLTENATPKADALSTSLVSAGSYLQKGLNSPD